MTAEHIMLGAIGFLTLCCIWYAITSPKGKAAVAKFSDQHPLIVAFERFEREGRELAIKQFADDMAARHAADFKGKVTATFAPKEPPPSASAGGS